MKQEEFPSLSNYKQSTILQTISTQITINFLLFCLRRREGGNRKNGGYFTSESAFLEMALKKIVFSALSSPNLTYKTQVK